MTYFIFLTLFICALGAQVYFFAFVFSKILKHEDHYESKNDVQAVSLVISARNELQNLQLLIPCLLKQDHPDFEIIVVDDRSNDGSEAWLDLQAAQQSYLRIIHVNNIAPGLSPKKNALTQGILQAKNPVILLTDADCLPSSNQWIRRMTAQLEGNGEACIGYGPYEKREGILNLMIRFETFFTAIQYFSLALAGTPYMGVGRNLAYTKSLFLRNNGFELHKKIWSGDDDLFGNQAFTKENVRICLRKESQVFSKPKLSYKSWLLQKTRHLSAGHHYKWQMKLVLGLLVTSHIFFYISAITLVMMKGFTLFAVTGILLRTLLIIYIFVPISKKLCEQIDWYWLPVLDFLYIFNYILFGLNSILTKNSRWT